MELLSYFSGESKGLISPVMVLMSDYRDHNDFSCINICRVPRKLFEYKAPRPNTFKLPPRDPANVNALKQTCLIVILAFI